MLFDTVDDVDEGFVVECHQGNAGGGFAEVGDRGDADGGDVSREDDVGHRADGVIQGDGFGVEDIECSGGDMTGLKCGEQGRGIDDISA